MSHKIILFLLSLISLSIQAQYEINGKVVDELNKPLNGCHVHIGNRTQNTNPDGSFVIANVTGGRKKLYVSYVGYKSIDTTFVVSGNIRLNLKLKKEITQLDEVVFHKNANAVNTSVLEQKIQLGTIEKYSNQTLGEALREVAGVSLLRTGSSIIKPIINGLHSSRVPIINNNVRLEDQQWGTEHAPNFDINAAGKITVIKGASALQYGGDAVGGLVVIDPVIVKKDTLYGKTIINSATNGQGGSISTSLHKGNFCDWSWNVQGTFKYMGDRESPDYVLSNTGNKEANFSGDIKYMGKKYDISAYYSYYNATIGILSASHIGSSSDLYYAIKNKVPFVIKPFTHAIENPKQEVQHHLAKINYNWYPEENTSLGIQYAFQLNNRLEFDIRRGEFANTAALDLELITHSLHVDYKKAITDWTFKTGTSTSYQNNFADIKTGVRPLIPTYDKIDLGAYGIAEYTITEGFALDTGLRYDFSNMQATKAYFKSRWTERGYSPGFDRFIIGEEGIQWVTKPEFTFHNISASLGFHKTFYHNWDWYVNGSLATRNPNPSEFFSDGLHHSLGVIELGDLRLQKEQALKISTTVQKKWNTFHFMLNPFVNYIQNYMFLRPTNIETTIRGTFPVWQYEQTNARLIGADLQTNWDINNNWKHTFSLAYVNGKDLDKNQPLIDMPPLNMGNSIRFSKKEWQDLVLILKSDLVFRQTQFPNFNFPATIFVNEERVPVEVDISTPPPAYHLLDFYSEIKINSFKNAMIILAFSVQNILNTNYRDYLNRQRFYADEMGRNFQLQIKINY